MNGTLLRVKRRRNAITSHTLQVEGLDEDPVNMLKNIAFEDTDEEPRQQRRRSSLWKRAESVSLIQPSGAKKRSLRIVDAVLDAPPNDAKRQKLTIVSTASPKKKGHKILSPVDRLVDDSLQKVYTGEMSVRDHFNFCLQDPRLASKQWLSFRNEQNGNILHACAMWNDVEMTSEILNLNVDGIIDGLDGEHRTPYDIADMCGHAQMKEVLEAFGADTAYVYDVYYLDDNQEDIQEKILCEMRNAYLDENGEIVYQASDNLVHEDEGRDAAAETSDVDSNDEDWEGNDYPDEEEWSSDDEEDDNNRWRSQFDDGDVDYAYDVY